VQEYKGILNKKVILDGNDIVIMKKSTIKEKFTFSDIIMLTWTESSSLINGGLLITTKKQQHPINFPNIRRSMFLELRDTLSSKSGVEVETKSLIGMACTPNPSEQGQQSNTAKFLDQFLMWWGLAFVVLVIVLLFFLFFTSVLN